MPVPYILLFVGEKSESAFLAISGMVAPDQTMGQSGVCLTTIGCCSRWALLSGGSHY